MAVKTLVHASDNLVRWKNAKKETDGTVITGATVTARVLDKAGTVKATGIVMSDQGAGLYEGTITDTASATLVLGELVTVEITFDGGAGLKRVITSHAFVDN